MKPRGSFVSLTMIWWEGSPPRPGDGLRTATGRRYVITEVRRRKLVCCVLGQRDPNPAIVFDWQWARRRKT